MKAQTPAEGILKTNDWGDSKVYRVVCECSDNRCDHNVWVEADEHDITVTTYITLRTNFWSKTRWSNIWTLLTKGYVDYESSILFRKQQALNYAETLKSAITDVEKFRENKNANSKTNDRRSNKPSQKDETV
jgi:hypothetical protein